MSEMPDKLKKFITGLGAIAESCGILRDQLISSGFTRTEAITLCQTYIQTLVTKAKGNPNEG